MTTRQLCAFYFVDLGDSVFKCKKCGTNRKQAPGSGYSNLVSHLTAKHPVHAAEFEDFQRRSTPTMDGFGFVDEHILHIFKWMNWIIDRNLPLSEVENATTRAIASIEPTTARTLKRYMQHVAAKVGTTIAAELGSSFGLMLDGWTNN